MPAPQRPLSPHLQVYKPQITSITSIMHRITGAALVVGSLLFVAWLVALAMGPVAFGQFNAVAAHPIAQLLVLGFVWAFWYQLWCGLKHIGHDFGYWFKINTTKRLNWAVWGLSVLCTAGTYVSFVLLA